MEELTKRLSGIVARHLPKEYTSVSYAIMKEGKLLAADALGHQGGEEKRPATMECTYNVASVSKIFCTVAVMQLVEQGKITLETPVADILPRFTMRDERYRKITLRHCLTHQSGLPGTQWRGFANAKPESGYYDDVYDYLSKSTLKDEPGAYTVYCNDGFTLAEMAVAEVSGLPFDRYCKENITDPIGAFSTRLAGMHDVRYPLVREGKKPLEYPLIQGGAGFTTTMADLCKFGQLFLEENGIISEKSKQEMASRQGRTFLKEDTRSGLYGLGWDNVSFSDPDYDLGEGVLLKGGNSFQFTTQFLVVPKYKAVLCMSETHDCKLEVNPLLLRLFATAMLEEGVNLFTSAKPVPKELAKEYAGEYLIPSGMLTVSMDGAFLDVVRHSSRGVSKAVYNGLKFDGERFAAKDGQSFFFAKEGEDTFLMTTAKGFSSGMAMKAKEFASTLEEWEKRVGKRYIVTNVDASDLVIYEIMTGFFVAKHPSAKGVYLLSFSGREDSGVYGVFEGSVRIVDGMTGKGFLRTPAGPSRDLIDPIFLVKKGVEYCDVASYRYRDVESLEAYRGQGFPEEKRCNGAYRITGKLETLPKVPEGHRLMVLDRDLVTVYDSLFAGEFKPVEEGYLLLI